MAESLLEGFYFRLTETGDLGESVGIACRSRVPFLVILDVKVLEKAPTCLLIYLDIMICLPEGFTVQFFEVFFQFLERTLLEDGITIEVYDGKEGFFYYLKIPSAFKLLPNKHEITKV